MAEQKVNAGEPQEERTFSVSTMPEAYRGLEGLKRSHPLSATPAVVSAAQVAPTSAPQKPQQSKPVPVPKKPVSPEQAAGQLQVAPIRRSKVTWLWITILLVVVLGGVGSLGWYFYFGDDEAAVPTAQPPVPVTAPEDPIVVVESPVIEDPVKEPEVDPFASEAEPVGGLDTDSDGLTDVEERLYGTVRTRPDTDSDGFLDGNEVFHLYHPNGEAPSTLLDTGAVRILSPDGLSYRIHTPKTWTEELSIALRKLTVSAPTGERFEVEEEFAQPGESLEDWYRRKTPEDARGVVESFTTKQGYDGIRLGEGLIAFVRFNDTTVLSFVYDLNMQSRIEFRQTFEMFINSVEARLDAVVEEQNPLET